MNKIITEYLKTRDDGVIIVITKATNNCYIIQMETGGLFDEAHDIGYVDEYNQYHPTKYSYALTNIPIKKPEIY